MDKMSESSDSEMLRQALESSFSGESSQPQQVKGKKPRRPHPRGRGSQERHDFLGQQWREQRFGRGAVAVGRAASRENSSGSDGYKSALEEEEKEEAPRVVAAAEPPERLCDAIDFELFVDPVVTAEGFTHSRRVIDEWFSKNEISPDTSQVMKDKTLIPNILVRQMVDDWKQANPGYKGEGGFINKKARKSRRKSRNKKNRNRRTKSKSRN
uniref:U-box domain-containing protein n=1 Tax=viral metagenome TaxID=1070528 RepID=A0A6C0EZA7_9ZZZZ